MKQPFIRNLQQLITGRDPNRCLETQTCVTCGGPAKTFKNEISAREYAISVMCQACQDDVFDSPDD